MVRVCAMVLLGLGMALAFRSSRWKNRVMASMAAGNKLMDGTPIEGDLVPLSNNLLVEVRQAPDVTKGGLFIPDNAKERATEGTVVSAGGGRYHSETGVKFAMEVAPGENVMYDQFDGSSIRYNEVDHQLIKEEDVLLVYEGEEALEATVRCIKDNILVRLPKVEDTNFAGIIVSTATDGSTAKKPDRGVVVKVGPGRVIQNGDVLPMCVQPGDSIRFRDFAGVQVKLGHEEYCVIKDHDVMVKWKA